MYKFFTLLKAAVGNFGTNIKTFLYPEKISQWPQTAIRK